MLEMDISTIITSFLFGAIGFVYMTYGKKMEEYSFILCGLLLAIFPYAIDDTILTIIIGTLLTLSPFFLKRYF